MPLTRRHKTMNTPTSRLCLLALGALGLALNGCGGALPHQNDSRNHAEVQRILDEVQQIHDEVQLILDEARGKPQAWFEDHWGRPGARSKRLFGGETWVYFRIAGGGSSLSTLTAAPAECQIRLDFTPDGLLEDSAYSGC